MRFGRWETVDELGRGGQAVVYRALDTALVDIEGKILPEVHRAVQGLRQMLPPEQIRECTLQLLRGIEQYLSRLDPKNCGALKVLHAHVRDNPKADKRLEREVAVLREQDHLHIVKVLDASVPNGWFVMEYFPLGSLEKHRDRFRGQPDEALDALRPLVEAVAILHAKEITHRDIAPKNVFVAERGLVLGDFGLVYPPEAAAERVSSTYENVGSRDWMPPWAMGTRQEDPTPAFDVFTLGKLLWAMVSGRHKLLLWYFRNPEFNLEALFPRDPRMVEVNRLLDRCIVQEEKDCLPSVVELLEAMTETLARLRGTPSAPTQPRARQPLSDAERDRLTEELSDADSLRGNLKPRTREGLQDLAVLAATTVIEENRVLMQRIVHYAIRDPGEAGALALQILNQVFVPKSVEQAWAKEARNGCLQLCLGRPSLAIAYEAVRLLRLAPEEGDTEYLAHVMGKWPDPLYGHVSPMEWLAAAYRRYPKAVRDMVDAFFAEGIPAEIQARASEARRVMRAIDQEQARSQ